MGISYYDWSSGDVVSASRLNAPYDAAGAVQVDVDNETVTTDEIETDDIIEKTVDAGVTIDGVKLKDSQPYCDVINEKTAATGVTVDGVLCKDNAVTASGGFIGNVTGNASGSSGSCTGNAATATVLANARTIGGTSFNGSANIEPATAVNHSGTYAHNQAVATTSSPTFAAVTSAYKSSDGSSGLSGTLTLEIVSGASNYNNRAVLVFKNGLLTSRTLSYGAVNQTSITWA
jgi:hypothetical protein